MAGGETVIIIYGGFTMNTIIGCLLLSLVIYSFVRLIMQGIREEKQDQQEEIEIWEDINYIKRKRKSA
jgi:large-conductance mechanosensitive channel